MVPYFFASKNGLLKIISIFQKKWRSMNFAYPKDDIEYMIAEQMFTK